MARGSKSRNRSSERDTHASLTRVARAVPLSRPLSLIQDFRLFDFEPETSPARTVFGTPASYSVGPGLGAKRSTRRSRSLLPSTIGFADTQRVVVCIRRKKRREVLFALKRRRKGSGARRRRRNFFSNVRC